MSSPLLLANSIHPQGAPSKFAPARLWKEASLHLVPLLLPVVNLQDTVLPSGWHEVQVCTIPKTAIAKLPKQLRPISLLHPGGKLLATMIAHRVLPKVERYLQSTPQWAYLPGRSTGDALEAVCAAHAPATSLLQTYKCQSSKQMCGGISVSLDIHKAFDSLPHETLLDSMRAASFDDPEIAVIMHLHNQATLCFGSQASATVFIGSGVRQGCSLPPLLWALITGLLHRRYQDALSAQQLSEGTTTLFADDVFGSWIFATPSAFKRAIRAIGVLIETIQHACLKLSMEKTVLLYTAQGTSVSSIIGRYRTFIDEQPHLTITIGQARPPLKVVQEHKYLGALLGYKNFELSNLRHRLSVMWGAFWRLYSIMSSDARFFPRGPRPVSGASVSSAY